MGGKIEWRNAGVKDGIQCGKIWVPEIQIEKKAAGSLAICWLFTDHTLALDLSIFNPEKRWANQF